MTELIFSPLERDLGAVLYQWRGVQFPFERLHLETRMRYFEQARKVLAWLEERGMILTKGAAS